MLRLRLSTKQCWSECKWRVPWPCRAGDVSLYAAVSRPDLDHECYLQLRSRWWCDMRRHLAVEVCGVQICFARKNTEFFNYRHHIKKTKNKKTILGTFHFCLSLGRPTRLSLGVGRGRGLSLLGARRRTKLLRW